MKRFQFSTSYRGDAQVALDVLLHPEQLVERMPFVLHIDVLSRPSPEQLTSSWEIELDGAPFTWREKVTCLPEENKVAFQMIRGDFQSFSGEWTVASEGDMVTVTLDAELDWGAPNLSRFVSKILDQKSEKAIRGMVVAVGRAAIHQTIKNKNSSKRFGFIFHPLDLQLFADGFGDEDLKSRRPVVMERVLAWFPPFRRGVISGVESRHDGTKIEGDMLLMTLLPKQMLTMEDGFILKRLTEAGQLGEQYGDKIIGLGAYAANVGRKGVFLAGKLNAGVTTGSCYTIAVAMEATLEAAAQVGINLKEASVAVIGATGTIGRVCAQLAAKKARHMILVARNQQRLEDFAQQLQNESSASVAAMADIDAAVANADLIICATNTPSAIIDIAKVRPGTIICDISRPRNITEEDTMTRNDVLVLDGGVVRPPGKVNCSFSFGLAPGLAYACIAETMILTLEGRYGSFSLGGNADLAKVEEISRLAEKHGFELAGLRSFEREVPPLQIEAVRAVRRKTTAAQDSDPAPKASPRRSK
ncbi:MAG: hypothetical protein COV76_02125 [Candidatus Omnitrophica bacterium CG11_big_fil_rev_8_21_14_0_20_64_10]|nr:MAG: hypothetical protein COV76_02125 [Candidatus Omnitrophica bacterium CG11_big_fil_rev_8_21_14_0_20_64_10]